MEFKHPRSNSIPRRNSLKSRTLPTMKKDHRTACACLVSCAVAWGLLQYLQISSPLQGIVSFFVVMVVTFTMDLKKKAGNGDQANRDGQEIYDINLTSVTRNGMYRKLRRRFDDPRSVAESLGLGNEFEDLQPDVKLQDPWNDLDLN